MPTVPIGNPGMERGSQLQGKYSKPPETGVRTNAQNHAQFAFIFLCLKITKMTYIECNTWLMPLSKTLHQIYMDAMARAFGPVIDIFITYCNVGRLFRKKNRWFSPHRSPTVGQISHALSVVALRGVWT